MSTPAIQLLILCNVAVYVAEHLLGLIGTLALWPLGPHFHLWQLVTYAFVHGGLAHTPNEEEVAAAAAKLGLPTKNWHRTDYLRLLKLIAESVFRINEHLESV